MIFVMLITIGANTFHFDHITYKDLETCQYHAAKMEYHIRLKHKQRSVECIEKLSWKKLHTGH